MTKIKLSLPTGSEVEKSVISYFNNGGNYLILDAESVGSMGLPIILVSKVVNDKVEKINDQNEWQQVKGYLKSIISGGQINYLEIPASMSADEVYYTQLTLPVASFDSLKKAYVAPSGAAPDAAPVAGDNVADAVVAPSAIGEPNDSSEAPVEAAPVVAEPVVNDTTMEPVNMTTTPEVEPASETPVEENVEVQDGEPMANPIIGEEPIANEGLTATVEPVVATDDNSSETPVVAEEPAAPVEENVEATPTEEPAIVEPVVQEPKVTEPASEPVVDTPVIESPVIENPVVAEPVQENPAESAIDTPAVDIGAQSVAEPVVNSTDDVKQRFMKACEELFDIIMSSK